MIPHHAWVILIRDDGTQSIIRASKNAEVRCGHTRARGDQLVGHPYGSTFEFHDLPDQEDQVPRGGEKSLAKLNEKRAKKKKAPVKYSKLVRVQATEDAFAILRQSTPVTGDETAAAPGASGISDNAQAEERDNRSYQANPENQKADSVKLRSSGASGIEIVRALAENSATFAMKNKFSQEKYLKRIMTKHVPRVTVVRATSRTVAEVLFLKHESTMSSDTIRSMRWVDALPQMIAYGNVHAAAKCLVLDGIGGLLSLAVLERLREDQGGRCYFVGTTPREVVGGGGRPFIDLLNIPKQSLISRFVVCASNQLKNGSIVEGTVSENLEEDDVDGDERTQSKAVEAILNETTAAQADAVDEGEDEEEEEKEKETPSEPNSKRVKRSAEDIAEIKNLRKIRQQEMFSLLNVANGGAGADSLLIAARHEPWAALEVLLPHLGLGRPFVVHHPCIEPLMVARAKLAESKACLDLTVTESFCREYQVLPDRTHPHMTGSATGGYMLRGIKVQPWGED